MTWSGRGTTAAVARVLTILTMIFGLARACRAALPAESASNELTAAIAVTPIGSDGPDSPWPGGDGQVIAESAVAAEHSSSFGVRGTVWVDIPAGAVTGGRLTICAIAASSTETPDFPSTLRPISTIASVSLAGGLQTGPLAIALAFDPGGFDYGEEPAVFSLNERSGRWVYLPSAVAPNGSSVSASAEHMGVFAVFPCRVLECLSDADDHWAEAEATALAHMDFLRGYPDVVLHLDGFVTREEAAELVARTLGLSDSVENLDFAADEAWSASGIDQLLKLGLLVGYPDGLLRPDKPLTRAEAAVILTRIMDGGWVAWPEPGSEVGMGLSTAEPAWAASALARLWGAQIIKGYPDGTLRPRDCVTRGELSVMLYRLIAAP